MASEAILLIPGLNCTERLFRDQIPRLGQNRTLVLANHRRHSDVDEIAAALLDEAPQRFALVGLSMGGYVAMAILRAAGERVSRLVLMDTTARPDTGEQTERREAQIEMAENGRFDAVADLQLPLLVHPRRRGDQVLVRAVKAMASETGAEAFIRQQRAIIARPDSRPLLSDVPCPALVVAGEQDVLTPPSLAQEMAQAMPDARLEIVADCGHLSTMEQPQRTSELLAEFLEA